MAIFNPNRTEGGTIKLVKDANGNYTTQEVGFNTLASLSIPDFKTTATTTKTDTKTATDNTGDTITSQTQMAFQMPERDDDNRIDTTGEMLQESAKKLSDSLQTVDTRAAKEADFASGVYNNRLSAEEAAPQENILDTPKVKDPASKVFRSETQRFKEEFDPTKIDSTLAVDRDLKGSAAVQRGEIEPPGFNFDFLKGDRFKQGTAFTDAAARQAMTTDEAMRGTTSEPSATRAAKEADFASGTLGVSEPSATRAAKEADFASGTFTGQSATRAAKEADFASGKFTPKRSAVETLKDSLTSLSQISPLRLAGEAIGGVLKAITPEPSNIQQLNTSYFTDRGDGRIGGNPATDLYAGFNRTSAFGNLEKAGDKRISRREKTIEKKGYKAGDKFYDDTQKMKNQAKDYKRAKAEKQKATQGPAGQGGASGTDSGKIVCTMMNESYGFGSFRNKIWMKFHGNIAPEYQKGYHRIFLPLVNYAKQKGITNKIIKNILEHIAVHSTIDMRQTLRGKRHTLGRLYRKIILPLCYWAGKK